ncbi:MAG: VacJ [Neisseriaceae bacterium]|nr:VacJ [Neisseriaceae bacterium]
MYEVNRSVVLLIPQAPFWAWLQDLPGIDVEGLCLEDLQADPNAYLLNPCEDLDDAWDKVEERLEEIFSAELADWCEDQATWPDLHPDIFGEWFDLHLSTIVTDLGRAELEREPFEAILLDPPEED